MPKTNFSDKLPPQNIEAEKSILGAIILDKESINKIVDFLFPQDFYQKSHQLIYEAALKLYEKNEPIDLLSLSNKLRESNTLDLIGGVGYLTSLVNSVPTAAHIINYAKIVNNKKILRDLIDSAHHILGLGHQEEENVEQLLDQAEQKLFAVSQKSVQQNFSKIGGELLKEAFERIDRLHKGDGALRGLTTGFYDLDNYLAGLQKSDLVLLAARPSVGKTSLALDIVRNIAKKEKIPVGLFSLEMAKEQIIDRILAAEAGISLWKLRTGKLSSTGENNDFIKIAQALDSLAQMPIFIDDTPSPTILQMRAMARRLQSKNGLGLLVVDYLQLIRPTQNSDSEVQQVTEISHGLKALARELNIPVLAVSQMSRSAEMRTDQRPKLSDLRSSGSLEQDADVVMFIYREEKVKKDSEKKGVAEVMIEKHRNGPTGIIELFFDEQCSSFRSLVRQI